MLKPVVGSCEHCPPFVPDDLLMVQEHITAKAVWHVVKGVARSSGIANLAPHDLRRSCARLCYLAGGELEQIRFLLGHVSVQTTERYLGCKQKLRNAVNDGIDLAEA